MTLASQTSCTRSPAHAGEGHVIPSLDPALNPPAPTDGQHAQAVLAGGCFWCTEAVFEQLKGVHDVVSGYAGGARGDANYEAVSSGGTDHAEAIRIIYDPAVITYGDLLKVFFTTAHDPTTLNRQGNDVGRQYRSAIFFNGDAEKRAAETYIGQLNAANVFDKPIVTTLEPLSEFHVAEKYHQDYAKLNPNQPYVYHTSRPKVEKTREKYPEKLK